MASKNQRKQRRAAAQPKQNSTQGSKPAPVPELKAVHEDGVESPEPPGVRVNVEKFVEVLQGKLAGERARGDVLETIIAQKDDEIANMQQTIDRLMEGSSDAGNEEPTADQAR